MTVRTGNERTGDDGRDTRSARRDQFLTQVVTRLRARTGVDLVAGGHVEPHTRNISIRCVDGIRGCRLPAATIPPNEGVSGRVVALGRYTLVESGRWVMPALADDVDLTACGGMRSVLAVPLRFDGRVLFVFYLARRSGQIGAATTRTALSIISRLAALIAQSTQTDRLGGLLRLKMEIQALWEIGVHLEELAKQASTPLARERIAIIQQLLEDSLFETVTADQTAFSLTRREVEVLDLVAQGLSNAEIATRLVVSPETVKAYLRSIRNKLGVRNRTAAVDVGRRSGLLG
ncbi:GAF domain-containing protein [Parafrankia irregularis]|uniref:GAF domain-containing protein n=1 Tax=Parafrankia irregularis TaxID=795642 RepID=A0A0S4QRH1_9ACTN|nr:MULTISPECIES: LuxR C-terminal-related transcriptional regulator [Parafrankia]CUU57727.1 GAF domain-containing protein [Parafrankia irregularis]